MVAGKPPIQPPKIVERLDDGVLHGPPIPEGCEWLGETVRHEVQLSLQPLKDGFQRFTDTICAIANMIWTAIKILLLLIVIVVVLLALGVLLGFVLAWKLLFVLWRLGPLITTASKALEKLT